MSCANCFKTHAAKPAAKKAAKNISKNISKNITKNITKKVTFNNTVSVIYFDKAPKDDSVCWQRAARERMRFKRRIHDVEQRIGWVFAPQHRSHMYSMLYL